MNKFGARGCMIAVLTLSAFSPCLAQNKTSTNVVTKKEIRSTMQRVFAWQIANPVEINLQNKNMWARAAFYAGVMSAYRATGDKKYLEQARGWAISRQWKLGERLRHADDQSPGQTYLELYLLEKDPAALVQTKTTLEAMMLDAKPGRED
jgi:rhamnogalacturonyl hydrolase YesR